jgi:hypothetical protein
MFDSAFHSLFLVDVTLFPLSLWTLVSVVAGIEGADVRVTIDARPSAGRMNVLGIGVFTPFVSLELLGRVLTSIRSHPPSSGRHQ